MANLIGLLIITTCLLLGALLYIRKIKKDIFRLNKSLRYISGQETNQQLTLDMHYDAITEYTKTINQLLEKQRSIQIDINHSNNQFKNAITNISHDIRTPLTSARGYVQMLKHESISPEKKADYIEIIDGRLKYLSVLLDELLAFSKLYEGQEDFFIESLNVDNILTDTLSNHYQQLEEKGFEVTVSLDTPPMSIMADQQSLERIFMNLIQNTINHGYGDFSVSTHTHNKAIIFSNRVHKPESIDIDQLTNRFYTKDNSRSNKSTGLGLAIVSELVDQLNGELKIKLIDDHIKFTLIFN